MPSNKLDPIVWLLSALILIYTVLMLVEAVWLKNDGQTFQILGAQLTAFTGALLMRLNPHRTNTDSGAPGATTSTTIESTVRTATPTPGESKP